MLIPRLVSKTPKESCVNTLILALTHGYCRLSAPIVCWGGRLGCSGRASRRKKPVMGKGGQAGDPCEKARREPGLERRPAGAT